jgi:hypothetical protein
MGPPIGRFVEFTRRSPPDGASNSTKRPIGLPIPWTAPSTTASRHHRLRASPLLLLLAAPKRPVSQRRSGRPSVMGQGRGLPPPAPADTARIPAKKPYIRGPSAATYELAIANPALASHIPSSFRATKGYGTSFVRTEGRHCARRARASSSRWVVVATTRSEPLPAALRHHRRHWEEDSSTHASSRQSSARALPSSRSSISGS